MGRWLIVCCVGCLLLLALFFVYQNKNRPVQKENPFLPDYVLPGARTKYPFEKIIPLLSTPELVSQFMKNNIAYTLEWDKVVGGNEYAPAKTIYERGGGKCVGHATLQCYILEKNGWDAYMLGLSIESPLGHNVCAVNINNQILVLDNKGEITGYFTSLAEIAKHYTTAGNMTAGGTVRTARASAITTTLINEQVFALPWNTETPSVGQEENRL